MNPETLATYAQDLSLYELEPLAEAIDDIGKEAPKDFKQLWPAVGVFLEAVRGKVRSMRQSSGDRWEEHVQRVKVERGE